jgi:hypothetical protein
MNIDTYSISGYFSTAAVTAIHFQDFIIAFCLGFIGALGGFFFKVMKDKFLSNK